jgi:hypothetical protein
MFAGLKIDACWCGDAYGSTGPADHQCDKHCPADEKQMCGSTTATSVYQTTCDGENRLSADKITKVFSSLDDDGNSQISLKELLDLFDSKNNDALELPDCDGELFNDYWIGDGICDDGSGGKANFNCKLYACDNGDCDTPCDA